LGDAGVNGIDQGQGVHHDDVPRGTPAPRGAAQPDRGVRHENALQHDVVRAGTAHAERSPGVLEVQADADQAKGKIEEAKASLKELGLNDSVESSG
jgi:hypothetical protein